MATLKPKALNAQIYTEASEWLVEFRCDDADPAGSKAFYQWLRTSPEHMRAYLELAALWNEGGSLDPQREFDDTALMKAVREQDNVLQVGVLPAAANPSARTASSFLQYALAACLVLALGGLGAWSYAQRGVYATEIGEQRTLTLSDGSHVELNARSKLRVRFSETRRSITLISGQAFFEVAKDPHRPLVVDSGGAQVRALGTQFDVYRKSDRIVVTVVEGKVAVSAGSEHTQRSSSPRTAALTTLSAGEQVILTRKQALRAVQPDVAVATAWTEGRLVFKSAALREVAEEFNRYNATPLVVRDPELADFKITGIFASTDPAALIRFLQARPEISVTRSGDEILLSR